MVLHNVTFIAYSLYMPKINVFTQKTSFNKKTKHLLLCKLKLLNAEPQVTRSNKIF